MDSQCVPVCATWALITNAISTVHWHTLAHYLSAPLSLHSAHTRDVRASLSIQMQNHDSHEGNNRQPMPACMTRWALSDLVVRPVAVELWMNSSLSVYCLQGTASLTPRGGSYHFSPLEEACVNHFHIHSTQLG